MILSSISILAALSMVRPRYYQGLLTSWVSKCQDSSRIWHTFCNSTPAKSYTKKEWHNFFTYINEKAYNWQTYVNKWEWINTKHLLWSYHPEKHEENKCRDISLQRSEYCVALVLNSRVLHVFISPAWEVGCGDVIKPESPRDETWPACVQPIDASAPGASVGLRDRGASNADASVRA